MKSLEEWADECGHIDNIDGKRCLCLDCVRAFIGLAISELLLRNKDKIVPPQDVPLKGRGDMQWVKPRDEKETL